jgi:hypothetical protein
MERERRQNEQVFRVISEDLKDSSALQTGLNIIYSFWLVSLFGWCLSCEDEIPMQSGQDVAFGA